MHTILVRKRCSFLSSTREKISCGLIALALFFGGKVSAAITSSQTGLPTTAQTAGLNITRVDVPQYVGGIISAILAIIGVVFLILIVYGGLLWMLAEGDETKVGKARGFIFHSIVGLILVFSAYAITNFVVNILIQQAIQ